MKLLALSAILLISGCTSLSGEISHISHPLRGPPFGPITEEDSLEVAQLCARRESKRFFVENCLGYRLTDGGFYGDDFIYSGRFGVRVEFNKL